MPTRTAASVSTSATIPRTGSTSGSLFRSSSPRNVSRLPRQRRQRPSTATSGDRGGGDAAGTREAMKRENAMQASDFETLGVPAGSMRLAPGGWPFQRRTARAPFHKRVVVLLGVTQVVVVPLAGLFLHADLWPVLPGLLAVLLLGSVGFAALATLFAAVAARPRPRD